MLAQWNITEVWLHNVLRDNACKMAKAMDNCGVASLEFMAHFTACHKQSGKTLGHFKCSQLASFPSERFTETTGCENHTAPQQDVPNTMEQHILYAEEFVGANEC